MDEDARELARRLFAELTARLEDAAALAADGQPADLDPESLAALAGQLRGRARAISALTEVAAALARGDGGPRDRTDAEGR